MDNKFLILTITNRLRFILLSTRHLNDALQSASIPSSSTFLRRWPFLEPTDATRFHRIFLYFNAVTAPSHLVCLLLTDVRRCVCTCARRAFQRISKVQVQQQNHKETVRSASFCRQRPFP